MIVYTDGGCKPSTGSYGSCRIETDKGELYKIIRWDFDETVSTNNEAEYATLVEALRWISSNTDWKDLTIYSDSMLMIKQLLGEYTINKASLQGLADEIVEMLKDLGTTILRHVPRKIIVAKLGH